MGYSNAKATASNPFFSAAFSSTNESFVASAMLRRNLTDWSGRNAVSLILSYLCYSTVAFYYMRSAYNTSYLS